MAELLPRALANRLLVWPRSAIVVASFDPDLPVSVISATTLFALRSRSKLIVSAWPSLISRLSWSAASLIARTFSLRSASVSSGSFSSCKSADAA